MLDDPAIPNDESKAGTGALRRFAFLPSELVDARVDFHLTAKKGQSNYSSF